MKTLYETSDGEQFNAKHAAEKHQLFIDKLVERKKQAHAFLKQHKENPDDSRAFSRDLNLLTAFFEYELIEGEAPEVIDTPEEKTKAVA